MMVVTTAEAGGAQVHVLTLCHALSQRHQLVLVTGSPGFLTEAAADLGVPVLFVPELEREISPRADLAAFRRLRSIVRSHEPDLVHCHSSKAGILGRLAAGSHRTPVVFTAHGWAFKPNVPVRERGAAYLAELMVGRIVRRQRIIAVSESDRLQALRAGICPRTRIDTVLNGVPDRTQRATSLGRRRVICVARLAPPKDHAGLLDALALLDSHTELDIVGDGPDRDRLDAHARAIGVAERVRFLGDRADVGPLLADADLFVLASRKEGLPLSILEAMAVGLPVVASDVGGVAEAVVDGVTGLLVPSGNPAAMADAIRTILDDSRRHADMAAAARRTYEATFTAEEMVRRTELVYRQLVGTDRSAPVHQPAESGRSASLSSRTCRDPRPLPSRSR